MSQMEITGWNVIEIKTFRSIFTGVSDTINRKGVLDITKETNSFFQYLTYLKIKEKFVQLLFYINVLQKIYLSRLNL